MTRHAADDQHHSSRRRCGANPHTPSRRRRGRLRGGLLGLILLVLLVGLLAALPGWLARSGRWKTLLAWSLPELAGLIDAQSLQFGWWTPLHCSGLVLRDPAGEPLAEVAELRTEKSLLGLLWSYPHLGGITADRAQVHLVLRHEGSNLEDFLARLPPPRPGAPPVRFHAMLRRAALRLEDRISGQQWQTQSLDAEITTPGPDQPGLIRWELALTHPPPANPQPAAPPARFAGQFRWQSGAAAWPEQLDAAVELDAFPLDALAGLLQRTVGEVRLSGPLSLKTRLTWEEAGNRGRLTVERLAAPTLQAAAPAWLGGDTPSLNVASGTLDLAWTGDQWDVKQIQLETSLGTLGGQVRRTDGKASHASDWVAQLAAVEGQLQGRLDLTELVRQLPTTLHRRPDTELHQGTAELTLASVPGESGRQWTGQVRTGPLVAVVGGQPVEFRQPIELSGTVRQTAQGLVLDQLVGRSDFLQLQGQGSLPQGQLRLRLSLDALAAQLRTLFDLGTARLAGTLEGEVAWQQIGPAWSAQGSARLQAWELALAGRPAWNERDLLLTAQMQGQFDGPILTRLEQVDLRLRSETDALDVQLTEPTATASRETPLPVRWNLRGELRSWLARVSPLLSLAVREAAGTLEANGQGRFGLTGGELEHCMLQCRDLVCLTDQFQLREPTVRAELRGRWHTPTATLMLDTATLASSALALRAERVQVTGGNPPLVSGTLDLRGDLGRLSAWLAAPSQPPAGQPAGSLTGRLELASPDGTVTARWRTEIEQFAWYRLPQPAGDLRGRPTAARLRPVLLWHEPRLLVEGQTRWEPATRRLAVEGLRIAGASLALHGRGTWDWAQPTAPLDAAGELSCDWEAFTGQVQSLARAAAPGGEPPPLGLQTLQVRGRQTRPWWAKGPWSLPAEATRVASDPAGGIPAATGSLSATPQGGELLSLWSGQASLGWDEARYVGLIAGPTELTVRLQAGTLALGPLDVPLAEGRLRAAPLVLLAATPPTLRLPGGPLLEGVRLSPEMCAQWLKFVAPLVAEATRAEGRLSLELAGGELPLEDPLDGQLAGTLHIHAAQIGPGPLAQQYLAAVRQLLAIAGRQPGRLLEEQLGGQAWLVLPPQEVPFALKQGVVTHRGLMLHVGELAITTQGSVDVATQQLDLAASFPLPESWFRDVQGPLAALRGQTITLPISGTLSRPRVQMQGLDELGKQLAAGVLGGLLRSALPATPAAGSRSEPAPHDPTRGLLPPEVGRGLQRLLGPRSSSDAPSPRLPR